MIGDVSETARVVDFTILEQAASDRPGEFADRGYLRLPKLVKNGLDLLRPEVDRLMEHAKRRDFEMECMGGSPRHMTTLGGIEIESFAPLITELYFDQQLLRALQHLIGMPLGFADDLVERHVLNVLHRDGDTHGFHVDDYPIALVLFVESPNCAERCGQLEVCPSGPYAPMLASHEAGDAYILRSDLLRHRVMPVHDGCLRTVLNFAYSSPEVAMRRSTSASQLYS